MERKIYWGFCFSFVLSCGAVYLALKFFRCSRWSESRSQKVSLALMNLLNTVVHNLFYFCLRLFHVISKLQNAEVTLQS